MINLESETICGYEVSAQMKRIWAMELDMVEKFVAVCREHGFEYMIMGGTLLGAVRHKGFIPWDNDIDILMPRKDFNKLLEIGPDAFRNPLFFQTPVISILQHVCQDSQRKWYGGDPGGLRKWYQLRYFHRYLLPR